MMGKHGAGMLDFDVEPDKKPRMSAETKKRANEKRQQTRKERGLTKGKKKRRR
jgi:hypothetical protein